MWRFMQLGIVLAVLLVTNGARAADQNHFASIYLDDKKIGQVQYTVRTNDQGVVEELKTRSSLSILGFQVYYFAQDLHEVWKTVNCKACRGTRTIIAQYSKRGSREIQPNTMARSMVRL